MLLYIIFHIVISFFYLGGGMCSVFWDGVCVNCLVKLRQLTTDSRLLPELDAILFQERSES